MQLDAKKTIARDDVTQRAMARKILKEIELTVNFNVTTLKLAEKFDHNFSHTFTFGNIFVQGRGFDAVTAKTSKYFVSIH